MDILSDRRNSSGLSPFRGRSRHVETDSHCDTHFLPGVEEEIMDKVKVEDELV